jgi:hypothetical protein
LSIRERASRRREAGKVESRFAGPEVPLRLLSFASNAMRP